jgi:hypothetical protein
MKHILRIILKIRARGKISRLCNVKGVSKQIGDALRETLQNDFSSDEKKWIDRIEILREELDSSMTKMSIRDYGAGTPDLCPTNEEMNRGRVVTKTVGEVSKSYSKPYFWSLLLFKLIRKFRPSICLELGTCLGISASFQGAALKLNGKGKIVTLEGAESLATIAERSFRSLSLDNVALVTGRFQDTLGKVLDTYKSIDYAFIDGHHDEKATIAYFKQIIPFLSEEALLVFDDISWSDGMKRAWKTIVTNDRINISINLRQIGVCIINSSIDNRENIVIPMV